MGHGLYGEDFIELGYRLARRGLGAWKLKQQGWHQMELRVELPRAKECLKHKRPIILDCIRQTDFEV